MPEPTILIWGSAQNLALALLYESLIARGKRRALFLLQETFPTQIGIYLKAGRGLYGALLMGDEELSFDDIHSVALDGFYISPIPLSEFNPADKQYIQTESWATLISLFHQLSRKRLVANHVTRRDYLQSRWSELCMLSAAGLDVPRALVTSHPEAAKRFYDELAGQVIVKPVAGGEPVFREFADEDLERLDRLPLCPVHYEEAPTGWACRMAVIGSEFVMLPEAERPPEAIYLGMRRVCQMLNLQLAEFSLRQLGERWLVTGVRAFLSPEALSAPHVAIAACELLEGV